MPSVPAVTLVLPALLLATAAAATEASGTTLAQVPPAVEAALRDRATSDTEVRVMAYAPALPAGCEVSGAALREPVRGSGRYAIKLHGSRTTGGACAGWAWIELTVFADVLTTAREVARGEPLAGALTRSRQEVRRGREALRALPDGVVAARPLQKGATLSARDVRDEGPGPGASVTVVMRGDGFEVKRSARAIPCPRGRACALMDGGRRVEGKFVDGVVHVELTP